MIDSWLSRVLRIHEVNGFTLEINLMDLSSSFVQVSQILRSCSHFFFGFFYYFCIGGWHLFVLSESFISIICRVLSLIIFQFFPERRFISLGPCLASSLGCRYKLLFIDCNLLNCNVSFFIPDFTWILMQHYLNALSWQRFPIVNLDLITVVPQYMRWRLTSIDFPTMSVRCQKTLLILRIKFGYQ